MNRRSPLATFGLYFVAIFWAFICLFPTSCGSGISQLAFTNRNVRHDRRPVRGPAATRANAGGQAARGTRF